MFSSYLCEAYKVNQSLATQLQIVSPSNSEQSALDLSQVYTIYSNVFIVGRKDYSACVSVILKGPYKQTGWLLLASPWKPLLLTLNNTYKPFVELDYDPRTMKQNPIANTTHSYAWDYDADNQVVFIKCLLTSTVTITIYYCVPKITEFATGKPSYSSLESIDLTLNIYGGYPAQATISWSAKLTIKDLAGKIVQSIDRDFKLSKDERLKLQYPLGTFKEGIYTAVVQIIYPIIGEVLVDSQTTFEVTTTPPPTPPPTVPWTTWMLVISIAVATSVTAYFYYRRRKATLPK